MLLAELLRRGVRTAMVTGDSTATAAAVARKVGIEGRTCPLEDDDAPALRQAQIGIAVSSATDMAKAATGMVLTEPGLAGALAAVPATR